MGATSKASGAADAARSLGSNPYVRRLLEDEELRENIRTAFDSARNAYSRMQNGNGPANALIDDNKVQRDLRNAADSLREASEQLRGKRRRRGGGLGKLLLIGVVGAVLVLVFSEDARQMLLDKLFGAEEEFEYTAASSTVDDKETAAA